MHSVVLTASVVFQFKTPLALSSFTSSEETFPRRIMPRFQGEARCKTWILK